MTLQDMKSIWSVRSQESRQAVLFELLGIAHTWAESAQEDNQEDAETLRTLVRLIESL